MRLNIILLTTFALSLAVVLALGGCGDPSICVRTEEVLAYPYLGFIWQPGGERLAMTPVPVEQCAEWRPR